jgi:hypothetical protein
VLERVFGSIAEFREFVYPQTKLQTFRVGVGAAFGYVGGPLVIAPLKECALPGGFEWKFARGDSNFASGSPVPMRDWCVSPAGSAGAELGLNS